MQVEWCPKCRAMLAPGTVTCPRCGKKLGAKKPEDFSTQEIFHISTYILGIALIPVILALALGGICLLLSAN